MLFNTFIWNSDKFSIVQPFNLLGSYSNPSAAWLPCSPARGNMICDRKKIMQLLHAPLWSLNNSTSHIPRPQTRAHGYPPPILFRSIVELCLRSVMAPNSYQVCLTVSSALCRVAKLSYVASFIMSSSAHRNFNYIFIFCSFFFFTPARKFRRSGGIFPSVTVIGQHVKVEAESGRKCGEKVPYPISVAVMLEEEGGRSTKHAFHGNYNGFPHWTNRFICMHLSNQPPIYLNQLSER